MRKSRSPIANVESGKVYQHCRHVLPVSDEDQKTLDVGFFRAKKRYHYQYISTIRIRVLTAFVRKRKENLNQEVTGSSILMVMSSKKITVFHGNRRKNLDQVTAGISGLSQRGREKILLLIEINVKTSIWVLSIANVQNSTFVHALEKLESLAIKMLFVVCALICVQKSSVLRH